jgi:hypothetical protein
VVFKAHSYIHTQMNFIVWQLPFTLFAGAVCSLAIVEAASGLRELATGGKRYRTSKCVSHAPAVPQSLGGARLELPR